MPKHYLGDPLECHLVFGELANVNDDESGEYVCFLATQPGIEPQKAKIEKLRLENLNIPMEKNVP